VRRFAASLVDGNFLWVICDALLAVVVVVVIRIKQSEGRCVGAKGKRWPFGFGSTTTAANPNEAKEAITPPL